MRVVFDGGILGVPSEEPLYMSYIVTPSALTTTLNAVNSMLATLGEAPVATLSPSPTSDADEALQRLDEVDLEVQSRGWLWNREHDYQLSKDGDNKLPLPAQTLRMVPSLSNSGTYDVVDRGGFLYDRTNHTFVFPSTIAAPKVDIIVRLDWDSLPQPARTYIMYVACQRFHAGKQGEAIMIKVNASDISRSLATLEQHEDELAQNSSTNGNPNVLQAIYGTGGLRRNRGGL